LSGTAVTYAAGGQGGPANSNAIYYPNTGNGGNTSALINGFSYNGNSGIVIIKWS
jgi:hypothetical protein